MKNKYKRKTLQKVGEELEKKVLGPFVNVFFDTGGGGQLGCSFLWKGRGCWGGQGSC